MQTILDWMWHVGFIVVGTGLVGWALWRWLKASDEPLSLIVRWILSAIVLGFVLMFAVRARDEISKVIAVLVGAVGGLVMAIIWRERLCEFVAGQFASLYTGGNEQVDPAPFYSIAEARRKRGQPLEAIAEVQKQLLKFPNDFAGWMLMAEIQAEDLKDLPSARLTIQSIIDQQPPHAPKNIAYALTRQADWELKFNQDAEAARYALERIVEILPDTEQSQIALQRIAHLTPPEMLAERHSPRRIAVPQGLGNIGLSEEAPDIKPPEETPEAATSRLVAHLEQFPYDNDAREKLALLYARHYRRLDLATDQLEQLIGFPNQPAKHVVHWLNLLADVQLDLNEDPELGRQTLQRIRELFPKTAAAENALNRIAYLNLELRPKQQRQAIKIGSYEENIGLKHGPFPINPAPQENGQ